MLAPDAFQVVRKDLKANKKLTPAAKRLALQKIAEIEKARRKTEADLLALYDWLRFGDTSGGFDWRLIRSLHGRK